MVGSLPGCCARTASGHCGSRSADQRDELASSQSIESHPVPASQGRIAGYRIASDQSAGSGVKQ